MNIKKIGLIIIAIFTCFCLTSCKENEEIEIYNSYNDLNGKTIGVITGSIYEKNIIEDFPDSKILYFSGLPDIVSALEDGKIDGSVTDRSRVIGACNENDKLSYFPDAVSTNDYAFAFTKDEDGKKLADEVSAFIEKTKLSGDLNLLVDKWINNDCEEIIDYQSLENINGEFIIASDLTVYPFSFVVNNQYTGFDVEFFYEFAKAYGYSFEIVSYDYSGMFSAVASGKADVMGSSVMYSDERAENLYFSSAYATGDGLMLVRKENIKTGLNNISDLKGKTYGTLTGSAADEHVRNLIEDVKFEYFANNSDILSALDSNKIDFADVIGIQFPSVLEGHPNLKVIDTLYTEYYAFVFAKQGNEELRQQLNDYIVKIKEDGTLDQLIDLWANHEDEAEVDFASIENNTKIINVATASTIGEPFVYIKDNQFAGYETDILVHFAQEYGYKLNISDYEFSSVISSVTTGKADIGYCSITITEERKNSVSFSNCYLTDDCYLIAVDTNYETEETDLLTTIKDKIYNTFIKEDRYLLYIDGVSSTLSITLLSMLFGTILGIVLYALFRLNNVIMNKLLGLYSWLITGMPTVVILMVFFYIIFGSSNIDGKAVAIICFTIIFSVSVLGMLKTCFATIPKGQFEAAFALGYNKAQTFTRIIIPQILPIFLPNYLSSVIELMKSSSIVGYIAVQDLTKASDIIRSRTYDAFFPLIATTIIYFAIAAILKLIINAFEIKTNPKKRKSIELLKGVQQHD